MKPTAGDVRCIVFGHVTRLAIWTLRSAWDVRHPTSEKLALVAEAMSVFGELSALIERCRTRAAPNPRPGRLFAAVARAERSWDAVAF